MTRPADVAWAVAVAAVTAGWVAVALGNGDPSPVDTTAMGAAAAAGAAALIGASHSPGASLADGVVAAVMLVVLPLAVAAAAGGSAALLAVALVLSAAAESAAPTDTDGGAATWAPSLVMLGAGLLVAGLVAEHGDGPEWALPSEELLGAGLAMAAAAALLFAAVFGSSRSRVLLAPGLVIGLVAGQEPPALLVALAGGALAVVCAAWAGRRPALALGFLALAAGATSATRPAAMVLAAGAVLGLALAAAHPLASLLGLPGGTLLAGALVTDEITTAAIALAVAAALTAAGLVRALVAAGPGSLELGADRWRALPAAALGVWLLLAPGTWGWAGLTGTGAYDRGAAAAVAGGAIVVLLARVGALRRTTA